MPMKEGGNIPRRRISADARFRQILIAHQVGQANGQKKTPAFRANPSPYRMGVKIQDRMEGQDF
jgi:hypothetical protein